MSKYFKLDRNSREIIIDKNKSYNVNIDIIDLIIDLQLERDEYKNRIMKTIGALDLYKYDDNTQIYGIINYLLNILRGEDNE